MKKGDPRIIEKNGKFYVQGKKQLERLAEGKCSICGEDFYNRNHGTGENKYCSRTCRGIHDRGTGNPFWKGGRGLNADGYVRVQVYDPDHAGRKSIRKFEHTLVMEKHIGRLLTKDETVHHKNGDRADNRIENLELYSGRHFRGQKVKDQLEWCKEFIAKYEGRL